MRRHRPWVNLAGLGLVAVGVALSGVVQWGGGGVAAVALGAGSGAVLAAAVVRLAGVAPGATPAHAVGPPRTRASAAVLAVLVALSAAEEVIWRGAAQPGAAAVTGTLGAVLLAAVGFALLHGPGRARIALHAATGATFGAIAAATGALAAAIAAHAAYNVTVHALTAPRRSPA